MSLQISNRSPFTLTVHVAQLRMLIVLQPFYRHAPRWHIEARCEWIGSDTIQRVGEGGFAKKEHARPAPVLRHSGPKKSTSRDTSEYPHCTPHNDCDGTCAVFSDCTRCIPKVGDRIDLTLQVLVLPMHFTLKKK
jgi:hypothetical protein